MAFSGDIIWVGPNIVEYNDSISLRIGYQVKTTSLWDMTTGWFYEIEVSGDSFPTITYESGMILGAGVGEYIDVFIGPMPPHPVCFNIRLLAMSGGFFPKRITVAAKNHCIEVTGELPELPVDEEEENGMDIPIIGIAAVALVVVGVILLRR